MSQYGVYDNPGGEHDAARTATEQQSTAATAGLAEGTHSALVGPWSSTCLCPAAESAG